jgi:type I restriction enzyme, S subunit
MTQTELTPTASLTGKWKPYPVYKDSGVEWLGEIPVHWLIKPLKHITYFMNGAPFKPSDWGEDGTPIIRIENLNGGEEFNRTTLKVDTKYFVGKGDLLFGWSGNRGTSFGPFIWNREGTYYLNQHIFLLAEFNEDRKWFYWLLKGVTTYVESQAHGIIGLVHITKQDLGSIQAPIIPEAEQKAIATFLDRELNQINALITKKERLIELLQEKRASLISHAVTKGLDSTVPMKDSVVEWLGEIPEHWEVKRVRDITELLQTGPFGSQLHSSDYSPNGIPVINPSHLKDGHIYPDLACAITEETYFRLERHALRIGDIVFARRGQMGRCALVTEKEVGWLCGTGSLLMRPRVNLCAPSFLNKVLSTYGVRDWLLLESVGTTMDNLNTSILSRIPLPIPVLSEQYNIITYLDRETAKVDALVSRIRDGIEKLKEYSTALISAAVTGKIDVRDENAFQDDENL